VDRLGLAGVWLLWVGWTYGVNRPEIEVNGQKLSAGSVDEHIRDTDMQALSVKVAIQTSRQGWWMFLISPMPSSAT